MRELEVEILRFFTGLQQPVLDLFAWILTFLGDETFYFIIIPFVYWCISKPFGIRLLYVFLISVYINASLKALTAVTRPVGIEGLNINALYVQSAEVGTHFPHDSFPSGHAQGSATLWGFIAYKLNRPKVWIAAGILVFLISIARLYTGVHWPTDLIVGVLIAAVIIAIYHVMEKRITALSEKTRLVLAVLVPVLMVILFTDSEGFSYGGFLLGAGIGFFLEKWYVGMVIPSRWSKRIIAYVIGVIGIFALQTGLKVLFPEGEVFDGLRYFIIGLFGIWIAPILFVKLGLYKKQ
ncbi:membrane-associated phospholipid phosphatase [Evansella vedderi]|uniref:Membrane-associated phospholipid phosphatase n=1 Tax=Evansella vedderi TaxID=38282 RepID=A0ABT9ZZ79_9BACI|nr:phosphatase PAP2 family protein [Evansella vedderi]MDQ0256559.1 membrane-associated phospholipid phosphatase [Evansella vedderi]